MANQHPNKFEIGLVMSGGGARGIAHLGMLQALFEKGIQLNVISGSSAGALVGAFIAAGHQPKTVLGFLEKLSIFNFRNFHFFKSGFFNMKPVGNFLKTYLPDTFDELEIPLIVSATDVLKGNLEYFSKGKFIPVLLASSCVPFIFEPVSFNGKSYVDGGVMNNFPTEPIEDQCKSIIGFHVNSLDLQKEHINKKDMLDRVVHLSLQIPLVSKFKSCDIFLQPPSMDQFGMFDFKKVTEIYSYGYEYAKIELKKSLNRFITIK